MNISFKYYCSGDFKMVEIFSSHGWSKKRIQNVDW